MKIVFLDIDGVLNSAAWFDQRSKRGVRRTKGAAKAEQRWLDMLDPALVERVNRIVTLPEVMVVVSSSWRHYHTLFELQKLLDAKGFEGQLIDKTPNWALVADEDDEYCRGQEIDYWLCNSASKPVESFVILDDNSDMEPHMDRLVRTHWAVGLQEKDVDRAVRLLEEG